MQKHRVIKIKFYLILSKHLPECQHIYEFCINLQVQITLSEIHMKWHYTYQFIHHLAIAYSCFLFHFSYCTWKDILSLEFTGQCIGKIFGHMLLNWNLS